MKLLAAMAAVAVLAAGPVLATEAAMDGSAAPAMSADGSGKAAKPGKRHGKHNHRKHHAKKHAQKSEAMPSASPADSSMMEPAAQ
ncbi:MAG: hypothetical protein SFW62_03750 [Alphaproteobacteria bacterium]|nr:hypothetical protein [Alphaproteobacteria bacterium]